MANIPPFIPITSDVLGQNIPVWFENFLHPYNVYGTYTSAALNGTLTLTNNIAGMRYPSTGWHSFTTNSKYSSGSFAAISFSWTQQAVKQPDEVRIGYCAAQNGSIGSSPVGLPVGGWTYNASTNMITINFITGLANSTTYYITFLVQ